MKANKLCYMPPLSTALMRQANNVIAWSSSKLIYTSSLSFVDFACFLPAERKSVSRFHVCAEWLWHAFHVYVLFIVQWPVVNTVRVRDTYMGNIEIDQENVHGNDSNKHKYKVGGYVQFTIYCTFPNVFNTSRNFECFTYIFPKITHVCSPDTGNGNHPFWSVNASNNK